MLHSPPRLSIIVPVYNEFANLRPLFKRLIGAVHATNLLAEIIFVDDRSTDGSLYLLNEIASQSPIPVHVLEKKGAQGKAFSLIEGFAKASGEYYVMIDADLQYPPEAISEMLSHILNGTSDIVVANRDEQETGPLRQFLSRTFARSIGSLLGLKVDIQSGLKVFRAEAYNQVILTPTAWGFDYQFLYLAKRLGWQIGSVSITLAERIAGKSQINILISGVELLSGALGLRLSHLVVDILPFLANRHESERAGIDYSNKEDFLYMPEIYSTRRHLYPENISGLIVLAILGLAVLVILSWIFNQPIPVIISSFVAALYLGLFIFKLIVVRLALNQPGLTYSKKQIEALTDDELPIFSIIVPLYQEAEVIPQIIKGMSALDYPKDKIDLVITLEEYDHETIDAIARENPPAWIKTLILPDVKPKTKPKALNVAFPTLKGEYMVIYDAEIIPDPDQLKKAVLAFREHPDVACLQVQLDHYNAYENWVTKLFNAEFSFYYDLFLPGLQKLGIPLPLSGHSSLYRTDAVRKMGAWDPYNVTEDAEFGMRLYRNGYKTEILQSRSLEESTNTVSTWVGQRTRWIKGFIQTTLVHMRHPLRFKRELGSGWKLIGFLIVVPGSVLVNLLNLAYWVLFVAWLLTRSSAIQAFFPGPILYVSVFSFLAGNFVFTYLNLIGSFRRGRYDIVKWCLLSPVYWLMLAYATLKASIEIVTKPHHWAKTRHGVNKLITLTPDGLPSAP